MANLSDFDEEGQNCIQEQVLQAESDHSSITSSVSTPRSPTTQQGLNCGHGHGRKRPYGVMFVADVVVLAAGLSLKCTMLFLIRATFPMSFFNLALTWIVQTALQLAVQSICALPSPRGIFTSSHRWQNATSIVSQRSVAANIEYAVISDLTR